MKRNPRCTAVHEAAHAIANCRYGDGFDTVHASALWATFTNSRGKLVQAYGLCEGTLCFPEPIDYLYRDHPHLSHNKTAEYLKYARERAFRCCVNCWVGIEAEKRQCKKSDIYVQLSSSGGDYEACKRVAKFVVHDERDEKVFINAAWNEAAHFVRIPVMWQAINALASLLQARGRIEADEPDVIAITKTVERLNEVQVP